MPNLEPGHATGLQRQCCDFLVKIQAGEREGKRGESSAATYHVRGPVPMMPVLGPKWPQSCLEKGCCSHSSAVHTETREVSGLA